MAGMKQRAEGFSGQCSVVLPRGVVAAPLKHNLLCDLLPTDVGFFPNAKGHFIKRAIGVDQAILIYCVKGLGWTEMEGSRREVHPGELLVIPPEISHSYGADDSRPWTIFWAHFKGENSPQLLAELGISQTRSVIQLGESPVLLGLFEELLDVMEYGYAAPRLLYASQILTYLIGSMIWIHHRGSGENLNANQKVTQSIAYMKQHLDQPPTAASFAALANFSEPP